MDFLISTAHAAGEAGADAGAGDAIMMNILFIVILVVLFYVLLILPQKKRFKEHKKMMDSLEKGDKVLTTAGFIGKVHKVKKNTNEIVIDLGNNVKITAVRSAVQDIIDESDQGKSGGQSGSKSKEKSE